MKGSQQKKTPKPPEDADTSGKPPPGDYVPLRQKIAYSMGVVSDRFATDGISIFFMAFFSDFLGVRATLVGIALALSRIWDAFTDPLAGYLSDKWKSRFGRRRPFIFVGAILTGCCFPALYLAQDNWSENTIFIYLCGILLLYYTAYSIFSVPYEAMGSELTPNYEERTHVFVVRSYIQEVFKIGVIWLFPLAIFLSSFDWVEGKTGGVRLVGLLVGVVIIAAGIMPALFCKERYQQIALAEQKEQPKQKFATVLRSLIRNKPLLMLVGIICTYLLAIISSIQLAYFVNVHYIYGGDVGDGTMLGALDGSLRFFFAILGAWLIKRYTNRIEKHKLMGISVGILFVSFIGIYFTHIPGMPWLTLAMKPLLAIGDVGFWILIFSLRADVCDWDEYQSGSRREGMVSAVLNWSAKLSISLAILLGGVLLEYYVGFQSKLPEGISQAPGTMQRMLLAYTVPPAVAALIALILLKHYPLTHKKMEEVRETLAQRRGE